MYDFCVIGSGFSGSTVSNLLSKKYKVCLIDKGRGPGGRSSNRRLKKNLSFDHGLQYLSPKSKKFKNFNVDKSYASCLSLEEKQPPRETRRYLRKHTLRNKAYDVHEGIYP